MKAEIHDDLCGRWAYDIFVRDDRGGCHYLKRASGRLSLQLYLEEYANAHPCARLVAVACDPEEAWPHFPSQEFDSFGLSK